MSCQAFLKVMILILRSKNGYVTILQIPFKITLYQMLLMMMTMERFKKTFCCL